ncbi:MAG: hypothetical protein K2H23_06765, partial [Oscillospiraceae bacterium]|nr:hypothetical protein [Oscillospiraceae bacterium]
EFTMKKIMEQLKEIIGVADEHSTSNSTSKEIKEIKRQIKIYMQVIKIFMFLTILCIVTFFISCIVDVLSYAGAPNADTATELYKSILDLIISVSLFCITIICKNIFISINNSDTPFIPQVSKGIRKISFTICTAFLVSIALQCLYPIFMGIEQQFFIDGTSMIFVSILMFLRSIFDYGYKLQQESDETL